jgi:predicted Zn-dependent protease with MMP-like domain
VESGALRLSADEFAGVVADAIASIPAHLRRYLDGVAVDVADAPTRDEMRQLGVRRRDELLGAYFGTPLTERSVEDPRVGDRIVIYQRNIERMCETRDELVREVAVTVLHEIGHHFGLDEDDLEAHGFG